MKLYPNGMSTLGAIRAFLRIDDHLATSGMPRPEHFAAIRAAGFETVINLALPTSDYALPNEGELVSAQGMTYIHIPVKFNEPLREDFDRFTRMMDACAGQKVFVHCAANMRVSAFVFLDQLRRGNTTRADAERDLKRIWKPDGVWGEFVNERLAELGQPPLQ
ncbi:MAG: protein tyrosine phosphatase family protein [Verrucomicrobia bacterium]|nr:protein tyrosine phosphatase family protein [Verrucomicrobiota bacterium]